MKPLLHEEFSTPTEIVASFTGAELLAAQQETSPIYDGIVLSRAVRIVKYRTGMSLCKIAERMRCSKTTVFRLARGFPCISHKRCERTLAELEPLLNG